MRTLFPRASRIAAARSALAVLLVGLASAAMAQVPAVNWKAERAEILRHYRALVQIDTSNPPGNETLAANYLKGVFEALFLRAIFMRRRDRRLCPNSRSSSIMRCG